MLWNLCKVLGVMNQERATRPRSQAVKTLPFHGSDTGSIPVGVISGVLAAVASRAHNPEVVGAIPTPAI